MTRIRVLPEEIANRIAAGEVVERPASVVKELVENAIDAGARRIYVELREGGRRLIKVVDDGCGMTPDDLIMAVQRFATSKITSADDLDRIRTLGFRGEALPSIGAVSQMRLTSRPPEAAEGATLIVRGGVIEGPHPIGCSPGTAVEVEHLFYNTPARLKFLATTATERAHCLEWIQRLALARPDIAFKFVHDGQTLFATSGQGDLLAVLAAIYGRTAAREFIPVAAESDDLRIAGYISGPRLTRVTRQHQFFFVNHRFVRSRALSHALSEAYGLLLPAGKNPVCAVHLTLPPDAVDPNVHPTKIEVRFRNPARVHQFFGQACVEALAQAGFRSWAHSGQRLAQPSPAEQRSPFASFAEREEEQRRRAERLRINPFVDSVDERDDGLEVFAPPDLFPALNKTKGRSPRRLATEEEDSGEHTAQEDQEGLLPTEDTGAARLLEQPAALPQPEILGQLDNKYIVVRLGRDLLIVDQHRAAERVLLHALEQAQGPVARQLLALPLTLELTPHEMVAIEEHAEKLAALGFELEPFGPNAALLRSVPAALAGKPYEVAIRELLEDLAAWRRPSSAEKQRQELLALIACHTAIKKGTRLTVGEMETLVRDLLQTQAPAVCPHGDPIIISLTGEQIDRRFRR